MLRHFVMYVERPTTPQRYCKHVIDNRDRFADCCVYSDDGSVMPRCVYKIILCKQNPRIVCFLKLTRHVRRLPDISAMAPGIQPQLCPFVFDFMPLTFYNEQSVPIIDDDTVSVATDMYFVERHVHHIGHAFGFRDFVRFHPSKTRATAHGQKFGPGRGSGGRRPQAKKRS